MYGLEPSLPSFPLQKAVRMWLLSQDDSILPSQREREIERQTDRLISGTLEIW